METFNLYLAPQWWNDLPLEHQNSKVTFKGRLKTNLFRRHLSLPTSPLQLAIRHVNYVWQVIKLYNVCMQFHT